MSTWTENVGRSKLRSFTDKDRHFWLEQNAGKRTKWAKLARDGHAIAWEFAKEGGYSCRILVDGEILTPAETTKKFLKTGD